MYRPPNDRELSRAELYLRMQFDPTIGIDDVSVMMWCLLMGKPEEDYWKELDEYDDNYRSRT